MSEPTHRHGDASTDPFLARVQSMIDADRRASPGRPRTQPARGGRRVARPRAAIERQLLSPCARRPRVDLVLIAGPGRAARRTDAAPQADLAWRSPLAHSRACGRIRGGAVWVRPRFGQGAQHLSMADAANLARRALPRAEDGLAGVVTTAGVPAAPSKVVQEALRALDLMSLDSLSCELEQPCGCDRLCPTSRHRPSPAPLAEAPGLCDEPANISSGGLGR
jgi:hypothetical protein